MPLLHCTAFGQPVRLGIGSSPSPVVHVLTPLGLAFGDDASPSVRCLSRSVDGNSQADPTPTYELDELILGLQPDRRAAFVLTQITGLRYEEAAEVLDVPVGTIRSRVARARADLVAAGELNQQLQRPTG